MNTKSKTIACSALLAFASLANAACHEHSFAVGMEFPDGSFSERAIHGGVSDSSASVVKFFVDAGVDIATAQSRAKALSNALAQFQNDPTISRATLSAQADGVGRVYSIRHICIDDTKGPHKSGHVVGHTIRLDDAPKIWVKAAGAKPYGAEGSTRAKADRQAFLHRPELKAIYRCSPDGLMYAMKRGQSEYKPDLNGGAQKTCKYEPDYSINDKGEKVYYPERN